MSPWYFSIGNWYVVESEDGFVCTSPMGVWRLTISKNWWSSARNKAETPKEWAVKFTWSLGNSEELLLLQRWDVIKQIWLFVFLRMCFVMGWFLILRSLLFFSCCIYGFCSFHAGLEFLKCLEQEVCGQEVVAFPNKVFVISVVCLNNSSLLPFLLLNILFLVNE